MVGESLVIKQGQPESHEINNEVIVNSLTANLLTVFFTTNRDDMTNHNGFGDCLFWGALLATNMSNKNVKITKTDIAKIFLNMLIVILLSFGLLALFLLIFIMWS